MISTVPTKHKRYTRVHINHGVVRMTSAGEEQAGTLSMSPSAAKPDATVKWYYVFEAFYL